MTPDGLHYEQILGNYSGYTIEAEEINIKFLLNIKEELAARNDQDYILVKRSLSLLSPGYILITSNVGLMKQLEQAGDKKLMIGKDPLKKVLSGSDELTSLLAYTGEKSTQEFQELKGELLKVFTGENNIPNEFIVQRVEETLSLLENEAGDLVINSGKLGEKVASSIIGNVLVGESLSQQDLNHLNGLIKNEERLYGASKLGVPSLVTKIFEWLAISHRDKLLKPLLAHMQQNKSGGMYSMYKALQDEAREKGLSPDDIDPMNPFNNLIRVIVLVIQAGTQTSSDLTSTTVSRLAENPDLMINISKELSDIEAELLEKSNNKETNTAEEDLMNLVAYGKIKSIEDLVFNMLVDHPPVRSVLREYGYGDESLLALFWMPDMRKHMDETSLREMGNFAFAQGLDRFCLGIFLALREIRLVVLTIIKRYQSGELKSERVAKSTLLTEKAEADIHFYRKASES